MILALDTEVTGLNIRHGCRPFIVTSCTGDGDQTCWTWDVDPLTRMPDVIQSDLDELEALVDEADLLVFHNLKFDFMALESVWPRFLEIVDWSRTRCTLMATHLLASSRPKDLTSVGIEWLGADITKYEKNLEVAVKAARKITAQEFPGWRVAKFGLPELPSAKKSAGKNKNEESWRADYWLPRAVAKARGYVKGECRIVNLRTEKCDQRIDRATKWGNPFSHLENSAARYKVSCREEAIAKYKEWVVDQPHLMRSLKELDGKTLGCFCKPQDCHGDVLRELVARQAHSWWTVASDYANVDSATTASLWGVQEAEIERRGLGAIYAERMKLLPITYEMESKGVTLNKARLFELVERFETSSGRAGKKCFAVAKSYDAVVPCDGKKHKQPEKTGKGKPYKPCPKCDDAGAVPFTLKMPKNGVNKSLSTFCFDVMKLPKIKAPKSKTGAPSLDSKTAIPQYLVTLSKGSRELRFIESLAEKRELDTALSYLESYTKFWMPFQDDLEWMVLYPSFNPTGTKTLRWSSAFPNFQQLSKREKANLRYCFGPAPGWEWWSLDAKNLELRIPAYEAGEQELIDLFERMDEPPYYGSEHLLNFHTVYPDIWEGEIGKTCNAGCCKGRVVDIALVGPHCKKKFEDTWYKWCKNGDFAVGYGAVDKVDGTGTADRSFHRPGAHRLLKQRFSKKEQLNRHWIDYANVHGYVETIPDKTVDPKRGYPIQCPRTERGYILPTVPLNYHVQSTAMWWMCKAMIRCHARILEWRREGFDARIVAQIHDEILFQLPKRADPRVDRKRSNFGRIKTLQSLMEEGGRDIGIPTPCSREYHPVSFNVGITI